MSTNFSSRSQERWLETRRISKSVLAHSSEGESSESPRPDVTILLDDHDGKQPENFEEEVQMEIQKIMDKVTQEREAMVIKGIHQEGKEGSSQKGSMPVLERTVPKTVFLFLTSHNFLIFCFLLFRKENPND